MFDVQNLATDFGGDTLPAKDSFKSLMTCGSFRLLSPGSSMEQSRSKQAA